MGDKITKIKQLNLGDFIKYSDVDDKGKYHYIGQITNINAETNYFWMLTMIGSMGFNLNNKHDFELTTDIPTGWGKYIKDPEKYRMDKSLKAVKKIEEANKKNEEEIANFKTTKERIFDIVKENAIKTDAQILKIIKKQINESDDKLSTQIKLARLKVNK